MGDDHRERGRTMRVIDLTQALADSLNEREPADEILVNGIRYVREGRAPESREGVKVEAYPGPGDDEITIAVEGHDDWLTIVSDAGTRITEPMVGYLRPASTGSDPNAEWAQHLQDTYDEGKAAARRELEQTPSYIHGFNAGFDEAVKQLSEECIVCGEPYVSHCEMDEPGVDHPSSCGKKHHEFQGSGDNDG